MLGDTSQVNLIAAVGAGGAIGPSDALPQMADLDEAAEFERWFLDLTRGGIILIGRRSFEWMRDRGFQGIPEPWQVAVWTRGSWLDSDAFISALKQRGRPIFVAGGAETYRTFNPYVTQYFIRKVALSGPHENYLPNLFGKVN